MTKFKDVSVGTVFSLDNRLFEKQDARSVVELRKGKKGLRRGKTHALTGNPLVTEVGRLSMMTEPDKEKKTDAKPKTDPASMPVTSLTSEEVKVLKQAQKVIGKLLRKKGETNGNL